MVPLLLARLLRTWWQIQVRVPVDINLVVSARRIRMRGTFALIRCPCRARVQQVLLMKVRPTELRRVVLRLGMLRCPLLVKV